MIPKTICMAFNSFIAFLSSQESFFPTKIRQDSRSRVGIFPLLICRGGFPWFLIATVSRHYRHVFTSDENFPKLRNDCQSRIWDPGISTFGSEAKEMKIMSPSAAVTILFLQILRVWKRYGHDDILSFSWSENSISLAIVLGFGLVKVQFLSYDDGDAYRPWTIIFSSLDMMHRFTQIHVISIHLLCLWYTHEARYEPHVSRVWFYCFARVNRIQQMSVCLILYSSEIHRCSSCFYQDNFLLNILLSMFWWHLGHSARQQWVTERLPHNLSEYLPESSNILMSTKRQDPGSSPTTLSSHFLSKVMPKAFWSLSSKLIANNKYVKEGHNRFYLLARKAFNSRVTLHSFIEIVSISYICVQWLLWIYSVPCKHF